MTARADRLTRAMLRALLAAKKAGLTACRGGWVAGRGQTIHGPDTIDALARRQLIERQGGKAYLTGAGLECLRAGNDH